MRSRVAVFLVLAAALAAACSGGSPRTLRVLAAASLTEAFNDLEALYEESNPDVDVIVSFGASSELALQIEQGVEADIFASADLETMARVLDAELAQDESVFARNNLAIVVEAGNPLNIRGLADLGEPSLILALAAPEVPAGAYAREALDAAGVKAEADTLEPDVKAVVTRVALGEADAGLVYATDVIAAGDSVTGVPIPPGTAPVADYPVAILRGSASSDDARAFIELLLSRDGQIALQRRGFLSP